MHVRQFLAIKRQCIFRHIFRQNKNVKNIDKICQIFSCQGVKATIKEKGGINILCGLKVHIKLNYFIKKAKLTF